MNGKDIINDDSLTIQLVRPENSISDIVLEIENYHSQNYIDYFDTFKTLELSLRYLPADWTKVFSGHTKNISPKLDSLRGQTLEVLAIGKCHALQDTNCNTSYGVESLKPTISTPKDILCDVVDNYINKSFGGSNTGYGITKTKIANITSPNITAILSPYDNNFNLINRICEIYTAYRAGSASLHWFVDPDGNLFVNTIGNHENNASGWPTFFRSSEVASTLEVGEKQILYNFQKRLNQYANKIVLLSMLRKPTYDTWTESQASDTYWYESDGWINVSAGSGTDKLVGSYSLQIDGSPGHDGYVSYPKTKDAGWDFSKIGSPKNPPTVNFYCKIYDKSVLDYCEFRVENTTGTKYFSVNLLNLVPNSQEWTWLTFPIGPYYKAAQTTTKVFAWSETGSPSWTDPINSLSFRLWSPTNPYARMWIDDLHIAGKLIREAYNSTAITNKEMEIQQIIRNDVAMDDSMKPSDDSGTTARLTYAELLRRQAEPVVGVVKIPLPVDILPGQFAHIHSEQRPDGSFRINSNFRITLIRDLITSQGGTSSLNLTSDLTNSFPIGPPTQASLMADYVGALGHKDARNLKGSGVDIEVPRLSKDYG